MRVPIVAVMRAGVIVREEIEKRGGAIDDHELLRVAERLVQGVLTAEGARMEVTA